MDKKMVTIEEKEEFMVSFFGIIGEKGYCKALEEFMKETGYGVDCIRILFHNDFEEWEEYRCKENEVALILDYPAVEEDTIGYLDYSHFYSFLVDEGQRYMEKQPEKRKEIDLLLKEVESRLGLN